MADGSERVLDLSIRPIRNDTADVVFLAAMGSDITERKCIEADREKFRALVESSTDFIGMCDANFIPFYINPAGLTMVGLDSLEQARSIHVRDFFLPEDQNTMMEQFLPSVAERGHGEVEVRFRHFKSGEPRWMAYKVLTLTDESQRRIGYATLSQDITERRRLEESLRNLAANLSAANLRKSVFLATLAHELRNPLAPVSNTLEILKSSSSHVDSVARWVPVMERQLGQLVRLVDDLMDLSRITHDRLELRKSEVELGELLRNTVESCRTLAQRAGHEVRLALPCEPIRLHADGARLTQVFANLLNNSCKYTPEEGNIEVSVQRVGGKVMVKVEDDGIGIPADRLEAIFEMFEQVDASVERSQGGLGIGLTLVKRLVEMHGGTVQARSAGPGQGSEFVVWLPVQDAEVPALPASHPPVTGQSVPKLRILVVDDNRDSAASLAMLLRLSEHEVDTAHDGAQALEAIERDAPDVVLLDIGMPLLNGYEVCRRVRERPGTKQPLLVALTGWGQEDDRRRSREAGFDHHLVKPVRYDALVELLSNSNFG
jgi:PAS domain S-box-containing protein